MGYNEGGLFFIQLSTDTNPNLLFHPMVEIKTSSTMEITYFIFTWMNTIEGGEVPHKAHFYNMINHSFCKFNTQGTWEPARVWIIGGSIVMKSFVVNWRLRVQIPHGFTCVPCLAAGVGHLGVQWQQEWILGPRVMRVLAQPQLSIPLVEKILFK